MLPGLHSPRPTIIHCLAGVSVCCWRVEFLTYKWWMCRPWSVSTLACPRMTSNDMRRGWRNLAVCRNFTLLLAIPCVLEGCRVYLTVALAVRTFLPALSPQFLVGWSLMVVCSDVQRALFCKVSLFFRKRDMASHFMCSRGCPVWDSLKSPWWCAIFKSVKTCHYQVK